MYILVWGITIALSINLNLCQENQEVASNTTDPNKDMYVIHAMVYQVGILSNKTDDDALNGTMGNQEAITLYHTNGSNIDLSAIPSPLMTNVTAQSLIGVAPKQNESLDTQQIPWSILNFTNPKIQPGSPGVYQGSDNETKRVKRSWEDTLKVLFKREAMANDTVKIVKGTAEIPQEAGVHSITLPPLLTLNNNFSDIPVPIPNTSVVHYAKINTVVRTP